MLHLYCITRPGVDPPAGTVGIAAVPVEAIDDGTLVTWVSRHHAPPAADVPAIRAHHHVVATALTPDHTPVPLRFGQRAADEDAVLRSVAEDAPRWTALLDRFAGHAEYGVRIAPAADPRTEAARDVHPGPPPSGKEYMAALARKQAGAAHWKAEAERIAADLVARAGTVIRDARLEAPAAAGTLFSLAHLVAWTDVDAYHALVDRLRWQRQDLRLLRSGPWPPYSFVA